MTRGPDQLKTLVAYCAASVGTQTTFEYLHAFARYLPGETHYLHVTYDARSFIEFENYDVIINSYCARLCFDDYVSENFKNKLRRFSGLKILAVQDEYDSTDILKKWILDLGFRVLLTCVPQDMVEYVYPKSTFHGVRIETVLTGYVADHQVPDAQAFVPLRERPITVGYRGRDIGGLYGKLGFDKFEIGRRMKEICDTRGISNDIRMDEDSRIYGTAWSDFIQSCRTTLGTESGSNVFDFDGSLKRRFASLARVNGGRRPSYDEFAPYISLRDSEINMGQISPRIFEYAQAGTPMILYRGRYSDAIEPETHYIPLERDFSNVDAVLARLDDFDSLEALARRAHEILIASGRFGYRGFVASIARIIEDEMPAARRPATAKSGRVEPNGTASPVLVEESTTQPHKLEDFLKRRSFIAFEAEIERMRQLERQVVDGFRIAAAGMRSACDASDPGSATSAARITDLLGCVDASEASFARLHAERQPMRQALFTDGRLPTLDELGAASSLYERHMHEMYQAFAAMDAAFAAARSDVVTRAPSAIAAMSEADGTAQELDLGKAPRRWLRRFRLWAEARRPGA